MNLIDRLILYLVEGRQCSPIKPCFLIKRVELEPVIVYADEPVRVLQADNSRQIVIDIRRRGLEHLKIVQLRRLHVYIHRVRPEEEPEEQNDDPDEKKNGDYELDDMAENTSTAIRPVPLLLRIEVRVDVLVRVAARHL